MYLVFTLLQMRKLLIIVLSYFPLITIAQVKTGVRGGINLAQFVYRPAYDGDTKEKGLYYSVLMQAFSWKFR